MSFFRNIHDEIYGIYIIVAFIISLIFILFDLYILSAFSIGLFVYVLLISLDKLGKTLPIKEILLLMFIIQMLITPLITYHFFSGQVISIKMHVSEEQYIKYAFFAVLAFVFGLNKKAASISRQALYQKSNAKLGIVFVIIGFIGFGGVKLYIPGLGFVFFIFSTFMFAGTYFLLFSKFKFRIYIILFVYAFYTIMNIQSGLFYALIIWSLFYYIFYSYKKHLSFTKNLLFIVGGVISLFILQSVKGEFREQVRANDEIDKLGSFSGLFQNKVANLESVFVIGYTEGFIGRLNTGWVVTKIMEHIPLREDFSNGDKLIKDVFSSFVPRFLYPNKRTIGGEKYNKLFLKYTGRQLRADTTVNIGMLGDMYINFGQFGGIIAMFFIGKLISWFYILLYKKGGQYIFLIPLLFFNIIRMNELFVILNSSIKVILMLFLTVYFLKKFFSINVFSPKR